LLLRLSTRTLSLRLLRRPDRYAFQTQIFFLLIRYRQQQAITEHLKRKSLLSDYFFAKDQLFAHLTLQGRWTMYNGCTRPSRRPLPANPVVYLRAETDTLMARIAMQDRPYERQMDRAYIEALRQGYETLFASYSATPLLILDTDGLDFVRNAGTWKKSRIASGQHFRASGSRACSRWRRKRRRTSPGICPRCPTSRRRRLTGRHWEISSR
jgi:deoxyadenosine/deoxycytidine kinase